MTLYLSTWARVQVFERKVRWFLRTQGSSDRAWQNVSIHLVIDKTRLYTYLGIDSQRHPHNRHGIQDIKRAREYQWYHAPIQRYIRQQRFHLPSQKPGKPNQSILFLNSTTYSK